MQRSLLLFLACAMSGTVFPVPEDVSLIAAGATLEGASSFPALVVAGVLGLLCRDTTFFLMGHVAGEGVFQRRLAKRLLGEQRITRVRGLVQRHGGRAVLISRFLVGVRATGFLVSGAMGVRLRDFFFWDAVGLVITVPLVLLLGYALGDPLVVAMTWALDHVWVVAALAALGLAGWLVHTLRQVADPPS